MEMKRFTARSKPEKCPRCGSARIARIQYGLPRFSPELRRDIEAGRAVLGGCMISGDDPSWVCRDCGTNVWMSNKGRRDDRQSREAPDENPDPILDPEEIDDEPEDGLEY